VVRIRYLRAAYGNDVAKKRKGPAEAADPYSSAADVAVVTAAVPSLTGNSVAEHWFQVQWAFML
jgi:hypothetical protein